MQTVQEIPLAQMEREIGNRRRVVTEGTKHYGPPPLVRLLSTSGVGAVERTEKEGREGCGTRASN